jgi:pyrroloquinoline quinone (PQQ) biosynthesis protein C
MAMIGRSDFGAQMVKALGLEGQKVRSIDLHISTHELVTATVVTMVQDQQAMKIVEVVSKYELVEIKGRPSDTTSLEDIHANSTP